MLHCGFLAWLIVGGISGWLAGLLGEGTSLGIIGDMFAGIIGAYIGGRLSDAMGIHVADGFTSSVVVALIGSMVLLLIIRLLRRAVATERPAKFIDQQPSVPSQQSG